MKYSDVVRAQIKSIVRSNAERMKDREIQAVISENMDVKPSLGMIRNFRVELGINKTRGRGVCRVRGTVNAEEVQV